MKQHIHITEPSDPDCIVCWIDEVERLREECEIGARRNRTMEETIERLRAELEGETLLARDMVAEVERLRVTPNWENPALRQRLIGLTKAIDEEMQPGSREFALGAVSDLIDERDALYRKQAEFEAEVERLREALKRAYEFLGMTHLPDQESSVPGQTTCPVCISLDIARNALAEEKK